MRKTLAQFYNILMKFRRDLRSPLFLSVTNLMDMLFEISFAGKVCAFMLPFEHVHSCVRFKKNKKQAFGQAFPPQCTPSPPPHTHTHTPHLKASAVPYSKLCFLRLSQSTFHNNASFGLFWLLRVDDWRWRLVFGEGGGVDFATIAACFQHGRGHACRCEQAQSVPLVK